MNPTIDELKELLKICYSKIPESRKGKTTLTNYDPAGSDYEFLESDWSIRIRTILDIKYEPTGI